MRRILPIFLCLCFCLSGFAGRVLALDVPPLSARVNDLAGVLAPATEQTLESNLAGLEETDSTQIVVLTIESLEGESLEEFALKAAETWGVGQKELDNGALLLVAVADRAVRIEVGYGLEDRLTDLTCGRIIRNEIVPAFREGDFDQGILNGVTAMTAAVQGAYTAADADDEDFDSDEAVLFGILGWLCGHIGRLTRRRQALWAMGLGGAGGLLAGLLLPVTLPLAVCAAIGAVCGGFALAFTVADLASGSGGRVVVHRGGRGGFGGGGGFSGGFGGGGGGFGGGGASGRW